MQIIMQWIYRNINSPFSQSMYKFIISLWFCAYIINQMQINRYWEQDENNNYIGGRKVTAVIDIFKNFL